MNSYDITRFNYCNKINNICNNFYRDQSIGAKGKYISSVELLESCKNLGISYRTLIKDKEYITVKNKRYYLKSEVYPFLKPLKEEEKEKKVRTWNSEQKLYLSQRLKESYALKKEREKEKQLIYLQKQKDDQIYNKIINIINNNFYLTYAIISFEIPSNIRERLRKENYKIQKNNVTGHYRILWKEHDFIPVDWDNVNDI